MLRLLFEKKGNAVWISHLDLMRVFQRAFKRADLPLTHTHGFNPRPSVSIALPLSVGIESSCELLDFQLDGEEVSCQEIKRRLNENLVAGIRVLDVYEDGRKIKYLTYLRCILTLEYDEGVPVGAGDRICALLSKSPVLVPKKTKSNGIQDQDIVPMIRKLTARQPDEHRIQIETVICCQNPTLNPMQIAKAIETYADSFDFASCCRREIYDEDMNIFR